MGRTQTYMIPTVLSGIVPSTKPQKIIRWKPPQSTYLEAAADRYHVSTQQVMRWILDAYMDAFPKGVQPDVSTASQTLKYKEKKEPHRPSTRTG